MRLKVEQFESALQKNLAPVYFFSGDEPLQLGELTDALRISARQNGFINREVLVVDKSFNWNELKFVSDSFSIFSDKRIIELRLPSGSVGVDGAKALINYCARPPEDTILLITAAKIDNKSTKSRWFEALDKIGVIIQAWPLEGADLHRWIKQRLQKRGLHTDMQGVQLLAARVEGNLLAAAQEIEKLFVLYGAGLVTVEQIYEAVVDSSRYDIFNLMDTLLSADINKIIKVLSGLRAEGIATPIVLWALTRETRQLILIKQAFAQGQAIDVVFRNHQVWDKRKTLVSQALKRLDEHQLHTLLVVSAKADRQIKGQESGDVWETLLSLCVYFCNPALCTNLS